MGFPLEYIYLVYFPPEYIYLVQSTSHSVFVGLVVRVRYVPTHLLGFQHLNCMIMKAKQVINPKLRHPKKNTMMVFHKVFLPENTMRVRTPILILMHTMPMSTMYTLILTVTLPWPPMVKIDLNCIIMKAKQVINSLKRMKTMAITMLRLISMMVTMPCHLNPIFSPNSTQRTSTRYRVSP